MYRLVNNTFTSHPKRNHTKSVSLMANLVRKKETVDLTPLKSPFVKDAQVKVKRINKMGDRITFNKIAKNKISAASTDTEKSFTGRSTETYF